mmetsp:Transcript_53286/g.106945  ORF Transcript_53286/g.106945 Transcript_53286/m.106945 type:complete len:201 (-) Transcript_53286:331-933(-)
MGGPATIDGEEVEHTDNFFVAPFVLDGLEWPTCEHYYQASKFFEDSGQEAKALVQEIRTAASGPRSWGLGQRRADLLRPDWEHVKVNMMYRAVSAKYAQHPELAAELAATSGPIQTTVSTADWQRMNRLILERVREELRPEAQRNQRRLAVLASLTEPRAQGDDVLREFLGLARASAGRSEPGLQGAVGDHRHSVPAPSG